MYIIPLHINFGFSMLLLQFIKGTPSNHRAYNSIYQGGDYVKQFQKKMMNAIIDLITRLYCKYQKHHSVAYIEDCMNGLHNM